jgi:hypothetical protein
MIFSKPLQFFASSSCDTANTQLAATIAAFDVPLCDSEPYTVQAGDGIRGKRVTWHFKQAAPNGIKAKSLAELWHANDWHVANPDNAFARCRRAFRTYRDLVDQTRGGPQTVSMFDRVGPSINTGDSRKAAALESLGHPLLGWTCSSEWWHWHFPQAAASDAALYDKPTLHLDLPTADISYVRAALINYSWMLKWIADIIQARVTHRGRVALIGVDAPKREVEIIEKLLYRK